MFVGVTQYNIDLKFNKIIIPYTSLYTWLAPDTINMRNMPNQSEHKRIIEHISPKSIEVILDDKFTLQINYGYSVPSTAVVKDFIIRQSAAMILISKKPLTFSALYKKANYLRNFLILLTGTKIQPKSIKVAVHGDEAITVFPDQKVYDNVVDEQEFHRLDSNYRQIEENFEEVICNWFKLSEKYRHPFYLYFQTKLEQHMLTLEIEFLRIVQALETSHRIEVSPTGTLEERLKHIFKNSHNISNSGIPQNEFIEKVVKIRHYYAHGFIQDLEKNMPDGPEFVQITSRLDLLMYGYIIGKLKIPDELKNSIMQKKTEDVQEIKTY